MKFKEIIREKGRKYLLPVAVGLSLLTGCGREYSLPISQETNQKITEYQTDYKKNHLNSLLTDYNIHLARADSLFNSYIKDRYFDINEQMKVFNELKAAKQDIKKVNDLTEKFNLDSPINLKLPPENKNLYSSLKENLEGVDLGTPELEKRLISLDFHVDVEKYDTPWDFLAVYSMIAGGLAIMVLTYLSRR